MYVILIISLILEIKNVGDEIIIQNSVIYGVKNLLFSVVNNGFQHENTCNRKETHHLLLKSILAEGV